MNDEAVTDLLRRLSEGAVNVAWREFLEQFSPLIMHTVRRYEADRDRAADVFVYVCAALSDQGFNRLLRYRADGPARFRTWLTAVVANACVDWHRQQRGRARLPLVMTHLPELEQRVYQNLYLRRMRREECLQRLLPQYPTLTLTVLSTINARLFSMLTAQQRWQLNLRTSVGVEDLTADPMDRLAQLQDPASGPEERAEMDQAHVLLKAAMGKLPPQQRLLLRLRFEQNLTLSEVARLTGEADPFRANRQIQAALATLAEAMQCGRAVRDRKSR